MRTGAGFFAGLLIGAGITALVLLIVLAPEDPLLPLQEGDAPASAPLTSEETKVETSPAKAPAPGKAPAPTAPPSAGPDEKVSEPEQKAGPSVIRGIVLFDRDSSPMKGIPVHAVLYGKSYSQCLSDEAGRFVLSRHGIDGPWGVFAIPYGSIGPMPEMDIPADSSELVVIRVPSEVHFNFAGTAGTEDGKGVVGAVVRVHLPHRKGSPLETRTGSGGFYRFDGLVRILERPAPLSRRIHDGMAAAFPSDASMPNLRTEYMTVEFLHPKYGRSKNRVQLPFKDTESVTLDITFYITGEISGRVVVPAGGSVDGAALPYSLRSEKTVTHRTAILDGDRFLIPFKRRPRLVIGGRVGDFWAEPKDYGKMSHAAPRKDLVVHLQAGLLRKIALVDAAGLPVERDRAVVKAGLEGAGEDLHFFRQGLTVEKAHLVLPPVPEKALHLVLSGEGFAPKALAVEGAAVPGSIVLDVWKPLVQGKLDLPEDFKRIRDIRVHVSWRKNGSSGGWGKEIDYLDRDSGDFRVFRRANMPDNALYTVVISLHRYKPWVRSDVTLARDEALENVVVSFGK
jgi:hypothetical protein